METDKMGNFPCKSRAPNYSVWHINLAFCPVLIYHWWFTGRTLGVNISLIRFSWQVCLVYSTIYHIHLQHGIMRHNKQSPTLFDYFRVEGKYISDAPCGSGRCLRSVLAGFDWKTIKWVWNQKHWHMAGMFCSMYGISWWSLVILAVSETLSHSSVLQFPLSYFFFPLYFIILKLFIKMLFCHLEKMRRGESTINKQPRQSPIM